jgi:hypothetical protein
MVVLTSKFNYLHRSNNSDFLVPQAPLFESDINYSAENSILIVGHFDKLRQSISY